MFSEKIARIFLVFLANVIVAKGLGPSDYGRINYAISVVAIAGSIATLGTDRILIQELVKKEFIEDELLGTAFFVRLIFGIAVYLALIMGMALLGADIYLIVLLGVAVIAQSANVIENLMQSLESYKYIAILMIFICFVTGMLKVIIITYQPSLDAIVIATMLESLLLAGGLFYANDKLKATVIKRWVWSKKVMRTMLRQALPMMLSGMFYTVFTSFDLILIKNFLGNADAGIYSSATKLASMSYVIPGVILSAAMPNIIKSYAENEGYDFKINAITFGLFWFGVFISIFVGFFSSQIVEIVFGNQYARAGDVLAILGCATPCMFLLSCWNSWMVVENKTALILTMQAVVTIINIAINMIAISYYQIVGAAYAFMASLVIGILVIVIFESRMKGLLVNLLILDKNKLDMLKNVGK